MFSCLVFAGPPRCLRVLRCPAPRRDSAPPERPRRVPTPLASAPTCIRGDGGCRIRFTGQASPLPLSHRLGYSLGFSPLGLAIGLCMLRGHLRRIHGHTAYGSPPDALLVICPLDLTSDTAAVPPPWRITATPRWFVN
jgi:hypothetical protein